MYLIDEIPIAQCVTPYNPTYSCPQKQKNIKEQLQQTIAFSQSKRRMYERTKKFMPQTRE